MNGLINSSLVILPILCTMFIVDKDVMLPVTFHPPILSIKSLSGASPRLLTEASSKQTL